MTCGTVRGEAFAISSGVLGINVVIGRDSESKQITVVDCAAARCIETDDSICWVDAPRPSPVVMWSNRSRTVRDVEISRSTTSPH